MVTGTVKWYDAEKGFGFVARDDGGDDLFVHRSAVGWEGLNEGDVVRFEVGYGAKGANAIDVTVTEKSTLPPRGARSRFGDGEPRPYGAGRPSSGRAPRWQGQSDAGGASGPVVAGVLSRYDAERGFGFIARDDGDDDVFVHISAFGSAIARQGDRVEFRVGMGPKGPRADQVRVVEPSAAAMGRGE